MIQCSWHDDGVRCQHDADSNHGNLPMCAQHASTWSLICQKRVNATIAKLIRDGQITTHSPGSTYVVELCDLQQPGAAAVVKIGHTAKMRERLLKLTRERGPGVLKAVLPGGRTQEAYLHHMFDSLRLDGPGELFEFTEPLVGFAAMHGVPWQVAAELNGADRITVAP